MDNLKVQSIPFEQCKPWLLKQHYAHRICPISYSYGIYRDKSLIGVITYGVPVSSNLKNGICGIKFKDRVLELNRLCCENSKNIASILISKSLKQLPKPSIIVSYADTAQGHIGYIYQATNFVYTGLSAKRTDWKIKGKEHLHGSTVADLSRGHDNRVEYMRDTYGEDFYLKDRPRKHRYIYFLGSKKQIKEMRQSLIYAIEPYPKGETHKYKIENKLATQDILF